MLYYFNTTNNHLINTAGAKVTARPQITFATMPVWTIRFCNFNDGRLIPLDLSEALSWRAAIDCDYNRDTAPMCRSLNDNIDISNLADGYVAVKLDANTETFYEAVKGRGERSAWFELWGIDINGDAIHYCKFQVVAVMPMDPVVGSAPVIVEEHWADRTWVEALFCSGYELEFSLDGEEWHSVQTDDDEYFHYRNRKIGGLWSDPVKTPKGIKGFDGHNAPEVMYQYSADASTWNDFYTEGDFWCRISTDGGDTWSSAILFRGPAGVPGSDGAVGHNAPEVMYQYSTDSSTWNDTYADGDFWCRISTDGGAAWSSAILFRGPAGAPGVDGTGFNFRGEFAVDADPMYQRTATAVDAVQNQGCLWAYCNDSPSNNAPPVLPDISNAYWSLVVAGAQDSTGGVSEEQLNSLIFAHDTAPDSHSAIRQDIDVLQNTVETHAFNLNSMEQGISDLVEAIPHELSGLSDVSDLSGVQDGQALVYDAASAKWQPGDVSGGGGGGSVDVYPAVATADAVTDETTGITTVKVRKVKITAFGTEYDGSEQTLICGWPAPIEGA